MIELTFGELKIGQTFFDPYSGSEWLKLSENKAKWVDASEQAWEGATDSFESHELVNLDVSADGQIVD